MVDVNDPHPDQLYCSCGKLAPTVFFSTHQPPPSGGYPGHTPDCPEVSYRNTWWALKAAEPYVLAAARRACL